ncbi:hypothetical protein ACWEJ6_48670 [Nonomuraea sp. NPDC004702]
MGTKRLGKPPETPATRIRAWMRCGTWRLQESPGARPRIRFESADDLITTEVEGSPPREALQRFAAPDGALHALLHGHVLVATKGE